MLNSGKDVTLSNVNDVYEYIKRKSDGPSGPKRMRNPHFTGSSKPMSRPTALKRSNRPKLRPKTSPVKIPVK